MVTAAKRSTRACRCGSTDLIQFESLNRKRCSNCNKLMYWPLDAGQERLNGHHRAGRATKKHGADEGCKTAIA